MKIRPVGAELFRADGRTDMTKLKVAFRNFAKRLILSTHLTENITTKHFHYQYQPVMVAVYPQNEEF